jgi:hypothetical protein
VVIHCYSFFGGYGRGNNKIKEEGGPINPKKGIGAFFFFLKMKGRDGMEINSLSPPPPMGIDAPLPSQRQGSGKRARNLSDSYILNP